jgi:hypothetical protein
LWKNNPPTVSTVKVASSCNTGVYIVLLDTASAVWLRAKSVATHRSDEKKRNHEPLRPHEQKERLSDKKFVWFASFAGAVWFVVIFRIETNVAN